MLFDVGLCITVYERGTSGVPTTSRLADLSGVIDSYSHIISATFGFETMTCSFAATKEDAETWLKRLMSSVAVFGPDAETVWEGYLSQVTVQFGQEVRSVSLDETFNRIHTRYTTVLGTPGTTSAVSDSDSIATYGTKDYVLSLPETTSTAASNLASAFLAQYKDPKQQPTSTAATGVLGEVRVTLSFAGWYNTLDWIQTSLSTTTSAVTTTQVGNLLTTLASTNNFIGTSTEYITASGISDTQYIAPDTTYRQKIESLLGQGNSSNQRLAWGVYEDRKFKVVQWAGATPSTVTYQRYLGDHRIYNAAGGVIYPWNVRPNAIYQVVELLDVAPTSTAADAAGRFYVERVTFSVGDGSISLSLEPQASNALDAIVARLN